MHERFLRQPSDLESALSLIKEMREALEWQEKITIELMAAQEAWVKERLTYENKFDRVLGTMNMAQTTSAASLIDASSVFEDIRKIIHER